MLQGSILPRFPWGIPPGAIKGVPGAPYLPPLPAPGLQDDMDAITQCWGCALSHVVALHTLYLGAGHSRVTERLQDISGAILGVMGRRANGRFMPFVQIGNRYGLEALSEHGVLVSTSEVGWWAVAAQASFALSAWYGLPEHSDEDAAVATKLHRTIRAGMVCMYGDVPAGRVLDLATGDGAGPLLEIVAKVYLSLEVKP